MVDSIRNCVEPHDMDDIQGSSMIQGLRWVIRGARWAS